MTAFERILLCGLGLQRLELSWAEQRKLLRASRMYSSLSDEAREDFEHPYKKFRWSHPGPLVIWVLLKMSVDRPYFVVFGPLIAGVIYLILFIQLMNFLVISAWSYFK
jgi:hypothetical protein